MNDQSQNRGNDDLFPSSHLANLILRYKTRDRERIFKVLYELFFKGPLTAYDLEHNSELEIKHAALFQLIKQIKLHELIHISSREEFRNTGLNKIYYDISEDGVHYLIEFIQVNAKEDSSFNDMIVSLLKKKGLFIKSVEFIERFNLIKTPKLLALLIMYNNLLDKDDNEWTQEITNIITTSLLPDDISEDGAREHGFVMDFIGGENVMGCFSYVRNKEFIKEINYLLTTNPFLKDSVKSNLKDALKYWRSSVEWLERINNAILPKLN